MDSVNEQVNPYGSPEADLTEQQEESYNPKIFSMSGRIGRARYLAYGLLGSLVLMVPLFLLVSIGFMVAGNENISEEMTMVIGIIAYIPMIAYSIVVMKRRLNDLDRSGWLSILMFIPVVNIFIGFYLLLAKGNQGNNRFGPPPIKNAGLIYVMIAVAVVFVLGIVAAIAIPAMDPSIAG